MFCDQQRRLHRGGPPRSDSTADALPAPQRALTCVRELTGADTTRCIPGIFSTWLVNWSLVMGNTMPSRDSDDDDGDEEEDDEPAVIREPDE
jgi:hypothetical protein